MYMAVAMNMYRGAGGAGGYLIFDLIHLSHCIVVLYCIVLYSPCCYDEEPKYFAGSSYISNSDGSSFMNLECTAGYSSGDRTDANVEQWPYMPTA